MGDKTTQGMKVNKKKGRQWKVSFMNKLSGMKVTYAYGRENKGKGYGIIQPEVCSGRNEERTARKRIRNTNRAVKVTRGRLG